MSGLEIIDFDPHPRRRIVKCNTKTVDGYALEEIPENNLGEAPGVALVNRDWQSEIYLMKFRPDWPDDLYFEEAERLIKEHKIQTKRKDLVD